MRIVALILATLLLVLTAGLGAIGVYRSLKDAKDIDALVKPVRKQLKSMAAAGDKDAKKIMSLADKTGRLRGGAVTFGLTTLLALALLVLGFLNRWVTPISVALVVVALVSIAVSPQYDLRGPHGPASARSLAIAEGVLALLGAAVAFGASRLKRRKSGGPQSTSAIG